MESIQFLHYLFKANTRHAVHSPFVYEFCEKVLNKKTNDVELEIVKKRRKELESNKSKIDTIELGGGSKVLGGNQKQINQMAKASSIKPKFGQLLYRIIKHYELTHCLELGTHFGIGSMYQLQALNSIGKPFKFATLEGCPETLHIGKQSIDLVSSNSGDIKSYLGNFDETLTTALSDLGKIDLIVFDGNHRMKPTIKYFEKALTFCHNDTWLIFDDIYWSKEMSQAWNEIILRPEVTTTIDLYQWGIVLLRKEMHKEHFTLRF